MTSPLAHKDPLRMTTAVRSGIDATQHPVVSGEVLKDGSLPNLDQNIFTCRPPILEPLFRSAATHCLTLSSAAHKCKAATSSHGTYAAINGITW